MKAKVKVKKIKIEPSTDGQENGNSAYNYSAYFEGLDKISINNNDKFISYEDDEVSVTFDDKTVFNMEKEVFDFINQHSSETIIIDFNNTTSNNIKEIVGVELIYG